MQNILSTLSILLIINALLLMFSINSTAQSPSLDLDKALPLDQNIKKGVLPNGMTYYLHKTDVTKDVASYYIIQNVGSILEKDHQRGLAHFLEHMAFNGTETFEGKGILNTLEKKGLVFGRDINAYTGFDETVYNIDNIPTTEENIDLGLQILHDWSNYLLLTEEEIDAERGVIKEEWRTRQNGPMRILQQSLNTLFNNSKYAQRLPIGTMDVVENFKYKALRDFYHDWYRTDLQAIAVIGDIDIEALELKIKSLFSPIPAVKKPKDRYNIDIPDNVNPIYHLAMDDEVTTSQIAFGIRHPKPEEKNTLGALKKHLTHQMLTSMLSTRLSELSQNPDTPFLGVRLGYGSHSRTTNTFSATIYPKPNQQQAAFRTALTAINRAVKHGFTDAEIARSITQIKKYYENSISKADDRSHHAIIQLIKQDYLEQNAITDMEQEYALAQKLFENTIWSYELHQGLKALYTEANRYITVTGVKGHDNLSKEVALAIIETIEEDTSLSPYKDTLSGKTLMADTPVEAGQIISEGMLQVTGSTTFTLSNGVKVHYKHADKNKNDVQLRAVSHGGLSLVGDEELPSAQLLGNVIGLSGLGDYSATDLKKLLSGKTANTKINLSSLTESITGASTTEDLETLLQLVHLRFVKPRFDEKAYQVLMENLDNYIIKRSQAINERIKDSVTATLYGTDNPRKRLFNTAFAKEVTFNQVKQIYEQRFSNAADFEFFIVGDIKKEVLKPLLETYLASIPTTDQTENWQDKSSSWQSDYIDKDIVLEMEDPKSSVKIGYKKDYPYSLKNALIAQTLGDILQLRYTETLREEAGGTYGASARGYITKRPKEQASIGVSFDCNPDKVEELIAIVHKEIESISKGEIKQSDLDKTKASYLKKRKEAQDHNSYDMRLLVNYFREGYNMNDPDNFENLVNGITVQDIQAFTKALLEDSKSYEIVFKPDGV